MAKPVPPAPQPSIHPIPSPSSVKPTVPKISLKPSFPQSVPRPQDTFPIPTPLPYPPINEFPAPNPPTKDANHEETPPQILNITQPTQVFTETNSTIPQVSTIKINPFIPHLLKLKSPSIGFIESKPKSSIAVLSQPESKPCNGVCIPGPIEPHHLAGLKNFKPKVPVALRPPNPLPCNGLCVPFESDTQTESKKQPEIQTSRLDDRRNSLQHIDGPKTPLNTNISVHPKSKFIQLVSQRVPTIRISTSALPHKSVTPKKQLKRLQSSRRRPHKPSRRNSAAKVISLPYVIAPSRLRPISNRPHPNLLTLPTIIEEPDKEFDNDKPKLQNLSHRFTSRVMTAREVTHPTHEDQPTLNVLPNLQKVKTSRSHLSPQIVTGITNFIKHESSQINNSSIKLQQEFRPSVNLTESNPRRSTLTVLNQRISSNAEIKPNDKISRGNVITKPEINQENQFKPHMALNQEPLPIRQEPALPQNVLIPKPDTSKQVLLTENHLSQLNLLNQSAPTLNSSQQNPLQEVVLQQGPTINLNGLLPVIPQRPGVDDLLKQDPLQPNLTQQITSKEISPIKISLKQLPSQQGIQQQSPHQDSPVKQNVQPIILQPQQIPIQNDLLQQNAKQNIPQPLEAQHRPQQNQDHGSPQQFPPQKISLQVNPQQILPQKNLLQQDIPSKEAILQQSPPQTNMSRPELLQHGPLQQNILQPASPQQILSQRNIIPEGPSEQNLPNHRQEIPPQGPSQQILLQQRALPQSRLQKFAQPPGTLQKMPVPETFQQQGELHPNDPQKVVLQQQNIPGSPEQVSPQQNALQKDPTKQNLFQHGSPQQNLVQQGWPEQNILRPGPPQQIRSQQNLTKQNIPQQVSPQPNPLQKDRPQQNIPQPGPSQQVHSRQHLLQPRIQIPAVHQPIIPLRGISKQNLRGLTRPFSPQQNTLQQPKSLKENLSKQDLTRQHQLNPQPQDALQRGFPQQNPIYQRYPPRDFTQQNFPPQRYQPQIRPSIDINQYIRPGYNPNQQQGQNHPSLAFPADRRPQGEAIIQRNPNPNFIPYQQNQQYNNMRPAQKPPTFNEQQNNKIPLQYNNPLQSRHPNYSNIPPQPIYPNPTYNNNNNYPYPRNNIPPHYIPNMLPYPPQRPNNPLPPSQFIKSTGINNHGPITKPNFILPTKNLTQPN